MDVGDRCWRQTNFHSELSRTSVTISQLTISFCHQHGFYVINCLERELLEHEPKWLPLFVMLADQDSVIGNYLMNKLMICSRCIEHFHCSVIFKKYQIYPKRVFKRPFAAERIFSPPRSPAEFQNLVYNQEPAEEILDDLPHHVDDGVNHESDVDDELDGDEELEDILNNANQGERGDDGVSDEAEGVNLRGRLRGSLFNARSSFMTGKFLRLEISQVPTIESGLPVFCCLCHIEVDRDEALNVTLELEKKLFKNGILGTLGDGLGISFIREGILDTWQVICRQCGYLDDNDTVEVDSEVYTMRFHTSHGNVDIASDNIYDAFSFAPNLSFDVIGDIREEFESLERMHHIQERYLGQLPKRPFHFTSEYQR